MWSELNVPQNLLFPKHKRSAAFHQEALSAELTAYGLFFTLLPVLNTSAAEGNTTNTTAQRPGEETQSS